MTTTLLIIAVVSLAFFAYERMAPATTLPRVLNWYPRILGMIALESLAIIASGRAMQHLADGASVFDLSELPILASGTLAYLIGTLVIYGWHRLRHENPWLWRVFHQLHHSPSRIEALSTFYRHPHELLVNAIIGAGIVFGLLGLDTEAATVYASLTVGVQLFYHANIRTPRALGYFIQRPEMHRIHHQRDRHRNNYGDLAIWDILFGTWENPEHADNACGFTPQNEGRLTAMLRCEDVHAAAAVSGASKIAFDQKTRTSSGVSK
jgi:sterol desaturase/sphingolipid hydroxylase (fatty acid hydroxylase superfamily)